MNLPPGAHLPAVVLEIVEVAGEAAAWALVRAKGGQEVYIPARVGPDHWLAELVGLEAARQICAHFKTSGTGRAVVVPMATQARSVRAMIQEIERGGSANSIALRTGKHKRTIKRWRKRLRDAEDSELPLFSAPKTR